MNPGAEPPAPGEEPVVLAPGVAPEPPTALPVPPSRRTTIETLLACAAPGGLLGILFAQLLFFLNPALPYDLATILRAAVVYGATGGLVSLAALRLLTRGDRRRALRLIPWGFTVAIGAAAVLGWVLPSYFAFYLPPAMNTRLIKAAIWLTAGALVSFYTALLHSLFGRRYGLRSRVGLALCVLAAVAAMAERRGAYQVPREETFRPARLERSDRPPLLVVGIDSATLDAILPLAEQGELPFFSQLLEGGAHAHLRSLRPYRFGSLWTTLATGKLPYKHGVISHAAFPVLALPAGEELLLLPPFQPFRFWSKLGSSGRRLDTGDLDSLTLWQVLARVGLRTGVVGWPISSPVEVEPAAMVADGFFVHPEDRAVIWPTELRESAAALRRVAQAAPLWPAGRRQPVPEPLAEAGIADRWRLEVAEKLAVEGWGDDALFVVLPGLRQVSSQHFGGYSAAQLDGIRSAPFLASAEALAAYYGLLDRFLSELWQVHGGHGLLAVVSAYGTDTAHGWQGLKALFSERRALAGHFGRSPDGVLILYGDGIRAGARLDSAQLVDFAPTLLYSLRLPVADDLDGRVLREAFTADFLAQHPLTFVPSFEALEEARPEPLPH